MKRTILWQCYIRGHPFDSLPETEPIQSTFQTLQIHTFEDWSVPDEISLESPAHARPFEQLEQGIEDTNDSTHVRRLTARRGCTHERTNNICVTREKMYSMRG